LGSLVTVVFVIDRVVQQAQAGQGRSASGKVMASARVWVVPNAARNRRSISRLTFNASRQQNTCPRVRLSLRTQTGRTFQQAGLQVRKSRSTFCRET